ncbi:hypothetical protein OROGR_028103 [Orobanche gracilis]
MAGDLIEKNQKLAGGAKRRRSHSPSPIPRTLRQPSFQRPQVNWLDKGVISSVFDQGYSCACVAISIAHCITAFHKILDPKEELVDVSVQYMYDFSNRGKGFDKWDYLHPANVFKLLMECGVCLEEELPWTGERTKYSNRLSAKNAQEHYSKGAMLVVDGWGTIQGQTLSEVLGQVILQVGKRPIIGAMQVNKKFEMHTGEGVFSYDESEVFYSQKHNGIKYRDLHYMMIYGYYFDNGHVFRVQNSYGPTWGNGGRGNIRAECFEHDCFFYPGHRVSWYGV